MNAEVRSLDAMVFLVLDFGKISMATKSGKREKSQGFIVGVVVGSRMSYVVSS